MTFYFIYIFFGSIYFAFETFLESVEGEEVVEGAGLTDFLLLIHAYPIFVISNLNRCGRVFGARICQGDKS